MLRRVLAFFGLALWKDLVTIHELAEVNMAYQLVLIELLDVQRQQIALLSAPATRRNSEENTLDISQIAILIFSSSSVWAFAGTKYPRAGFVLGLCGQPFWIYTTFTHGQWGMFIVSLWFTANHIRGLWNRRTIPAEKPKQ